MGNFPQSFGFFANRPSSPPDPRLKLAFPCADNDDCNDGARCNGRVRVPGRGGAVGITPEIRTANIFCGSSERWLDAPVGWT